MLNLYNNRLETLPREICRLTRLERLSLQHNPFESLPACLAGLSGISDFLIEAEKRRLLMDWSYPLPDAPPRIELEDMGFFPAHGASLVRSLLSALEERDLTDAAPEILAATRSAVKIETTVPDDYSVPGNSRFGGFPDLAIADNYPAPENGAAWNFLVQLNLADLAPHVRFLPPSGLLLFFVQTVEPFGAKVLFLPDDPAKLVTVSYAPEDPGSWDDFTLKPHRVRFEPFLSLPWEPGGSLSDTSSEAYERYSLLVENPNHQINGDSSTLQFSARQDAADRVGGLPEEWVPLLQLGYDDKADFCFSDAGTFYFSIHREALRRWDFSNIQLNMESG
ncbi:MAG: DUF1963 domain-containing protein [Verrucomicrobiaceae bacterium]|nr:MAG: DUF1963 domain-containing protein [Verrucomicrobiaceae bacterium]